MSDEQKENLGGVSPTEGVAEPCSVPTPELSPVESMCQFTGPLGAFYLRPSSVDAVGHAQNNPFGRLDEPDRMARFITTRGGFSGWMWDEPENMARLLL